MPDLQVITEIFQQRFDTEPQVVCEAPGRVNLIGEHTDYNDGFVMPAAINFGTFIAASRRDDNQVFAYAEDFDSELDSFSLDDIEFNTQQMWSNYLRGTLKFLKQQYHNLGGINLVISGNVPHGAGLSSSASFEIAILRVMVDLFLLELDGVKAAVLAQRAENEFVGCNCGIMDQLISALGQEGQAMLLDCRSLAYKYAPIPSGMQILVVNSNVKRGLVDSEYNLRRQQCEQVAEIANISALRDMDLPALQTIKHRLTEIQYKRALHVITENMRTADALQALVANDIGLLSQLMRESHDSLRDNFQVSTEELDGLVEIIDQVIGQHGGVRMTGGGFGGCVVALVPRSLVSAVIDAVTSQYQKRFRLTPDIYQCQASMGAFRL